MWNVFNEAAFFIQDIIANLSFTLKSKKRTKKVFLGGNCHSARAKIPDILSNFQSWTKSQVYFDCLKKWSVAVLTLAVRPSAILRRYVIMPQVFKPSAVRIAWMLKTCVNSDSRCHGWNEGLEPQRKRYRFCPTDKYYIGHEFLVSP